MNSLTGPSCGKTSASVGHQQMHAVHECWRNENALWHEELKLWQDELKKTRENLAQVLAGLDAHAKKLEKHGASLTLYSQQSLEHEHALAEYERVGNAANLEQLDNAHQGEVQHHARARDVHEQLKRLHHTIVARCSLLAAAEAHLR